METPRDLQWKVWGAFLCQRAHLARMWSHCDTLSVELGGEA
jgi:hypothetical protein